MGSIYGYQCDGCGLSASVSSGMDRGMIAVTRTFYCCGCQTLKDIGIDTEEFEDILHLPQRNAHQRHSDGYLHCPSCDSTVFALGRRACHVRNAEGKS